MTDFTPILAAGLHPVDWAILVLYASSTIFLGWWFGRRQASAKEYFVGSGKMNPILIGISLFATLLSTISYLSFPGESAGKGPVYMANYLIYPVIFLVVGFVIIPVYMRQRVTSAYELLEERLGGSIRILGAVMFLALRLVWMSLLIYMTAKALSVMVFGAGEGDRWIPLIVIVTGAIAITYTMLGGLRAVVITDLMQTILLYGGALLIIGTVTWKMGGFGWFPTEWKPHWDTQPLFPDSFATRVTLIGTLVQVGIWYICTAAGDQVSVQRFMATTDARAARKALAIQLTVAAIVGITLGFAGFALLGYFESNPADLAGMDLKADADQIYPHFVANMLPPVVSGLVLAGLFAAAMSSVDSGVNSITAVVTSDFVDRFRSEPISERSQVIFSRVIACSVGLIVVLLSSLVEKVPGNFTAVTNKTVNLLTVPIFCLFFFALFVKFARPIGVWIGAIAGTAVAALVAFSGPIVKFMALKYGWDPADFGTELIEEVDPETGEQFFSVPDPISFQWIGLAALVTNISVGLLFCWIFRKRGDGGGGGFPQDKATEPYEPPAAA